MKILSISSALKTGLMLASAGMMCGVFAADAAAEALYFYPAKPWKIEQTQASCKISSEFNNGYIVSVEHQKGSANPFLPYLSIDFRQPAFSAGQIYYAQIGVEGVPAQTIPVKALREEALNFSFGAAPSLSAGLMQAPMLDFTLDSNEFHFALAGLVEQEQNFRDCLTAGYQQPTPSVVYGAPTVMDTPVKTTTIKTTILPDLPAGTQLAPVPTPSAQPMKIANALPADLYEQISKQTGQEIEVPRSAVDVAPPSEKPNQLLMPKPTPVAEPKPDISTSSYESVYDDGDEDFDNHLDAVQSLPLLEGEDWDLEKATLRYQEAERQLTALGQKLQKERARCKVEKKELEALLFDPQLTTDQQLAKLADLEEQLRRAKQELRAQEDRYQDRIRLLEKQLSAL